MIERDVLVATRQVWPDQQLRVHLRPYRGQTYISVQRYYDAGDEYKPGRGGCNVNLRHLAWLIDALHVAETEARSHGLLAPDDGT